MAADTRLKFDRAALGGPLTLSRPNSNAANAYFGRTAVASAAGGHVTAVVSTGLVAATSLILTGLEFVGQGSAQTPITFGVSTISPGGFFRLDNIGSVSLTGSHTPTVMWALFNPR